MKKKMPFYDLHCHILPRMDDGIDRNSDSMEILIEEVRQGCRGVIATPHLHLNESISSFLERRGNSYFHLMEYLEKHNPYLTNVIGLGAEVTYWKGISETERLEKLCFGRSNFLLITLPDLWTPEMIEEITSLPEKRGINPILSQYERYPKQDSTVTGMLLRSDVILSMDAGYLLSFRTSRKAQKLIHGNIVQLLSSGCHDLDEEAPNMERAIGKLHGTNCWENWKKMYAMSRYIFNASTKAEYQIGRLSYSE